MKKIIVSSICAAALFTVSAQAVTLDFSNWVVPTMPSTSKTFIDSLGAKDSANKANFDIVSQKLTALNLSDLKQVKPLYDAKLSEITTNAVDGATDLSATNEILNTYDASRFSEITELEAGFTYMVDVLQAMEDLSTEIKGANLGAQTQGAENQGLFLLTADENAVKALFNLPAPQAVPDPAPQKKAYEDIQNAVQTAINKRDTAIDEGIKAGLLKLLGDSAINSKEAFANKIKSLTESQNQEQDLDDFLDKINPIIKQTYDLISGGPTARESLKAFANTVATNAPEYQETKDNLDKLKKLQKLYPNKSDLEALMSALDALNTAGALDPKDDTQKQVIEEAKKAEVAEEKTKVETAVNKTLSTETAKVVSSNEAVASNIVEAKSTLIDAQSAVEKAISEASVADVTVTKDIYDGGLKELKEAMAQVNAKNASVTNKAQIEELIKKVEAKIQTALNEAAEAVAEEKHAEVSTAALNALNIQINNMNKRLGEIRGLNGEIGAWLRVYGSQNKSETGSKAKTYSTQIGADKKIEFSDADLFAGALFGYDRGSFTNGKSNTYSLGAYASYVANEGFFADAVFKYAKVKHKYDAAKAKSQNIFLASLEGGYRFDVREQLYIEPSLELITGRISKFELSTSDYTASVKAFTPLIFKSQIFMGASAGDFTLRYGIGAVINAHKANEIDTRLADFTNNGLAGESSLKMKKSNHGFASVGMAYRVSENLRINFSAEHTFGSKNKGYELNSTIRYTF